MRPVQNDLSDEQFHGELIKRFFHPKSYFYRCIKQEIDALVKSPDPLNGTEYELFDEVVEKIVSSEDKEADLGVLEQIEGFGQVRERLEDGIRYLRENQLGSDRMKIEIENLAQSLIKVGVQALFDDNAKTKIQAFLNSQIIPELDSDHTGWQPESQPELDDFAVDLGGDLESKAQVEDKFDFMDTMKEPEEPSDGADQFDEIPLELIEDLQSDPTHEKMDAPVDEPSDAPIEKPLPDRPESVDAESFNAIEPTDLEEDFLLLVDGGEDTAAGREDALPSKKPVSAPKHVGGQDIPSIDGGHKPSFDDGPVSFVDGFGLEIKSELAQLQKSIDRLRKNPGSREHWASCDSLFDKIAAKSMVGGFEGFEQVSMKARKFVARCMRSTGAMDSSSVETLSETCQTLLTLFQGDIDHVDRETVAEISKKLERPRRKKRPRTSQAKEPAPQPQKRTSVVTDVPSLSESPPVEPVLQEDTPHVQEEQSDFDISKFKLPGEDDNEIINLVHEISEGEERLNSDHVENAVPEIFDLGVGDTLDFEEPGPAQETPLVSPEQTTAADQSVLEANASTDQERFPSPTAYADDKLTVFKDQSEFYFNIVQDSFEKLQANPDDKIALEDLELSSHSLYELSLKLNLDAISSFPAAVERAVKSRVSANSPISSSELQNLVAAYEYFAQLSSVEQATSSTASSLIAAVDNLTGGNRAEDVQVRSSVDMDDDSFHII
jgi:hypothetical protein